MPTPYPSASPASIGTKLGIMPDLWNDYTADRTGVVDATAKFNTAVSSVTAVGASPVINIPAGCTFALNAAALVSGIRIKGDGPTSILKLTGTPLITNGMINIPLGTNGVSIEDLTIDMGQVTANVINFSGFSGNVLDAGLTTGTAIWIKGSSNVIIRRVNFTGIVGYSIIVDATLGNCNNITIEDCYFYDIRADIFGVAGVGTDGGWNGNILYINDGVSYTVNNLFVRDNVFERVSGHCLFGATQTLGKLNTNIHFIGNYATDHAKDMCELAAVSGFKVMNNHSLRGGYFSSTTGAVGTPFWGSVAPAVIDHTRTCINGVISGNTIESCNGTGIDGDGLGSTVVSSNSLTSSWFSQDPNADSTHCGPSRSGTNVAVGFNLGNTFNDNTGDHVVVDNNRIRGFGACAIAFYTGRYGSITNNNIDHPGNATVGPISYGPTHATNTYQRCYGNNTHGNHITWSPGSPGFAVVEDGGYAAFVNSDVSLVYDNEIIGNAQPFFKDPNSGGGTDNLILTSVTPGSTATGGHPVGTHIQTEGISLAAHVLREYRAPDGAFIRASTVTTTDIPSLTISGDGCIDNVRNANLNSVVLYNATGSDIVLTGGTVPLVLDGSANARLRTIALGPSATFDDLITNSASNIVDAQGSPVGTTHGFGITLKSSALGYMVGIENTDNATNANGLLIKVANNNILTRVITVNVAGSDLFAVNALGFVTAQAYSVGTAGVITAGRDFYGDSLSIGSTPAIAASAAGLTIANDRTAYLAQVYIGANGASPLLVIDNTGTWVGGFSPTSIALGTFSYTAAESHQLAVHGNGAMDNAHIHSPAAFLLGVSATSIRLVEDYIYPTGTPGVEYREAAVDIGVIVPSGSINWETDGLISRVISFSSSTAAVCGSFFGISAATNAIVWAQNWRVADYINFNESLNHASTLVGCECDLAAANTGTNISGFNVGVYLPGTRSLYAAVDAIRINLNGGYPGFTTGGHHYHYFNRGIWFFPGSCEIAMEIGLIHASLGTNSQFVNFISGSTGQYLTKMYTSFAGYMVLQTNTANVGGTAYPLLIGPLGTLGYLGSSLLNFATVTSATTVELNCDTLRAVTFATVTGVTNAPGVILSNGFMQADQGFKSLSILGNAVNIPNGGVTCWTASITSGFYNSLQTVGGASIGGCVFIANNFSPALLDCGSKLEIKGTAFPASWQAIHTYAVNDQVLDNNSHVQVCTTGGVSSVIQPSSGGTGFNPWNMSRGSTVDNTVTWRDNGPWTGAAYYVTSDYTGNVTTYMGSTGGGGFVGTRTGHPFGIRTNNLDRIAIDTAGVTTFGASINANGGINAGNQGIVCGGVNPFGGHFGQGSSSSIMFITIAAGFTISYSGPTPPTGITPGFYHALWMVGGVVVSAS